MRAQKSIDFSRINWVALSALPALLRRWLPHGHREGAEWVALNPRRNDRTPGSFKINIHTDRWADFASGDRGGDVISLAANVFGHSQAEAARRVTRELGL
jgi:hypothetical protein